MRCRKPLLEWSSQSLFAGIGLCGLLLGCSPAGAGEKGSARAPASSAAATPVPAAAEDSCLLALAERNARYITSVFGAVEAWAGECHPHVDELEQLTWAEIPESSQPLVESHWHEQFRQAKVERAIELGVPASSVVCAPGHPDCDTMTDDDAGLSYAAVVRVAILQVLDAVQAAAQENTALRGAPIDERRAGAVVGSQERHLDEVRAAVLELHALVPPGGVLPELQLPAPSEPMACR
jgi:hypothetical protein